jgi:hypothetical protein
VTARPERRSAAKQTAAPGIAVSVIVLVTEGPQPLVELYEEYASALRMLGRGFEFVFAAEPRYTHAVTPLAELARRGQPIRVLEVGQAFGDATLLRLAAMQCRGSVIVTTPPTRKVETAAIAALIRSVEGGADLAVARRWPRHDSWINRLQNRAFHALLRVTTGTRLHDVACGVRAMRPEVLREVPIYGDYTQFFPVLAARDGYRVTELDVPQHPSDRRAPIYAPGMYLRRLLDTLGLYFLVRFTEKPLRFFGLIGSGLAIGGAVILAIIAAQRLAGRQLADRPLLLLGVLLVVLGAQAVALGLVGEIIVHLNAPGRRPYRLAKQEPPAG